MVEAWYSSKWTRWIVEMLYDQIGKEYCAEDCEDSPLRHDCGFNPVLYERRYDWHAGEDIWQFVIVCCCYPSLGPGPGGGIIIIPPDEEFLPGEDEGA